MVWKQCHYYENLVQCTYVAVQILKFIRRRSLTLSGLRVTFLAQEHQPLLTNSMEQSPS
jgi:hypothetical protein